MSTKAEYNALIKAQAKKARRISEAYRMHSGKFISDEIQGYTLIHFPSLVANINEASAGEPMVLKTLEQYLAN